MSTDHPTQTLAHFAASLTLAAIPAPVLRRAEDLLLDWLACALAGKGARPVETIARFAERMGPADGPCEILVHRTRSSPLMAAAANAAASHFAEQDDVHNGAVFHPGTVVFPPALAVAQALGSSGAELLAAAVAGYEVGIRVGEYLGRSHYRIFHTTGTAGTFAAAAAAGRLLRLSPEQMLHAFGSAGTQSAGLWEFLREGADSKQLHTAHAAGAGLTAAYLAQEGYTGAARILDGAQGLAAGTSSDADPARLTDGLGTRWTLAETSFKFHAACRHTHPAADALQQLLAAHALRAEDVRRVTARVHQARDRRARAGDRSADRAPVQVLDGHGARHDRRARPRGARRVRRALPGSGGRGLPRQGGDGARPAGRGRLPRALDRESGSRDRRRPAPRSARGRTQGRPGQHAHPRRARGQGAAACAPTGAGRARRRCGA